MDTVELVFAAIGAAVLILLVVSLLIIRHPPSVKPGDPDPAAPYREGLHTAVRMQRAAQDMEQEIYTEAARHLGYQPGTSRLDD